jgi:hypothetical protein
MYSASSEVESTAQLAAGMTKLRCQVDHSPRARRAARRFLQTSAASDPPYGQPSCSSPQTERFLFVPCEHCPHDRHANVQCFKRVQLSTTAWNRLRHTDARDTLVDQLPTARAQSIDRQENPSAPVNALPKTIGAVLPSTVQQQTPVNHLPLRFAGVGRGSNAVQYIESTATGKRRRQLSSSRSRLLY